MTTEKTATLANLFRACIRALENDEPLPRGAEWGVVFDGPTDYCQYEAVFSEETAQKKAAEGGLLAEGEWGIFFTLG